MIDLSLLIDEIDNSENINIFESFAVEFEKEKLLGRLDNSDNSISKKVELIERRIQDLSEKKEEFEKKTDEEQAYKYSQVIQKTRDVLKIWHSLYSNNKNNSYITEYLDKELDNLSKYLIIENIELKSIIDVLYDFKKFIIDPDKIQEIRNSLPKEIIYELRPNSIHNFYEFYLESMADIIKSNTDKDGIKVEVYEVALNSLQKKLIQMYEEDKQVNIDNSEKIIPDGENVIYSGEIKLWIDSNNAAEVNEFLYIVTSVLESIENVSLKIIDSGQGSFYQKCKIFFKGWFAKEETKEIIQKSQDAAKGYLLDRHIEPTKKLKKETEKIDEDIKRMIDVNEAKELNKLKVEMAKEDLVAKKLGNISKRIEISKQLSHLLGNGLASVDSDFRIEIEGMLIVEKNNGQLNFDNVENIDKVLTKELSEDLQDNDDDEASDSSSSI